MSPCHDVTHSALFLAYYVACTDICFFACFVACCTVLSGLDKGGCQKLYFPTDPPSILTSLSPASRARMRVPSPSVPPPRRSRRHDESRPDVVRTGSVSGLSVFGEDEVLRGRRPRHEGRQEPQEEPQQAHVPAGGERGPQRRAEPQADERGPRGPRPSRRERPGHRQEVKHVVRAATFVLVPLCGSVSTGSRRFGLWDVL